MHPIPESVTPTNAAICRIDSGILPSNNADLQELFLSVRYEHPPIDTQLEQHNVRAIELDAWPDEQGGKFRCNAVRRFFRLGNYVDSLPEMSQPGFKVRCVTIHDFVQFWSFWDFSRFGNLIRKCKVA